MHFPQGQWRIQSVIASHHLIPHTDFYVKYIIYFSENINHALCT